MKHFSSETVVWSVFDTIHRFVCERLTANTACQILKLFRKFGLFVVYTKQWVVLVFNFLAIRAVDVFLKWKTHSYSSCLYSSPLPICPLHKPRMLYSTWLIKTQTKQQNDITSSVVCAADISCRWRTRLNLPFVEWCWISLMFTVNWPFVAWFASN